MNGRKKTGKYSGKCPECGSTNIIGGGWMLTKRWGKRHRLKCADCATTFYDDVEVKKQ